MAAPAPKGSQFDARQSDAKRDESPLKGIDQFYVNVDKEEWKLGTLCDLYDTHIIIQSVIFVNTRHKVDWLTDKMRARNHIVSATHGGIDHNAREAAMHEFQSGKSQILITTDLMDLLINQYLTMVINFDLPKQPEAYVHRADHIRRFRRKGATLGVVINFVTKKDEHRLQEIQRLYNTMVKELP